MPRDDHDAAATPPPPPAHDLGTPDRVRIELCDVMTVRSTPGRNALVVKQSAEIWLFVDGKVKGRKPAARIVAESRPELLRDLADWIEQNNDPGLTGIVQQMPK